MRVFAALSLLFLAQTAVAKDHKIGFLLSTMNEERYKTDKSAFEKALKAKGSTMVFLGGSNNDPALQTEKVKKLLDSGIEVLVIQPVDKASGLEAAKLAKAKKVPVIAYDRLIDSSDVALYVTQDSCKVGQLQAEAAIKATNGSGNAVICMGQKSHSVADEITRCAEETLKKSQMKVIVKENHDAWSPEQCEATVLKALKGLKNEKLAAVLANNSGMAHGAVLALKTSKLDGQVFVAGADATSDACSDIKAGLQTYDVLKAIAPLAEAAADNAVSIAEGQTIKGTTKTGEVPTVVTEVTGFDKNNMKDVLTKAEGWEKIVAKCGL